MWNAKTCKQLMLKELYIHKNKNEPWGAWLAQSVEHVT